MKNCKITNRDNDGLVLIKEWLVTRSRIDNSQPLMSQVKVTALIEPTPIWTTVLQPVTIIIRQHYSSNCNFDTHKFVDYNSIIGPISPLSSSNLRNNNLLSFVLIKRIMSKNPKYFIRFLVVFNIFHLKSGPTSISPNTVNSFS